MIIEMSPMMKPFECSQSATSSKQLLSLEISEIPQKDGALRDRFVIHVAEQEDLTPLAPPCTLKLALGGRKKRGLILSILILDLGEQHALLVLAGQIAKLTYNYFHLPC